MKHLIILSLLFLFYFRISVAQTDTNIPGPENVLVVYKLPAPNNPADTMSRAIKDYYINARGIPSITNVLGLQLPRKSISIGNWSDPHIVKLGFDNQNIVDSTWATWDSTHCVDTAKFHGWQYFLDEIADPIRQHLVNNNLTETIRYIVMCQGVPYKIQTVGDYSSPGNISVDGLLCMLNTSNYDDFVEAIFNNMVDDCYPGCDPPPCYSFPIITNPYFDEDSNFDFDSRFKSDNYTGSWGVYNYTLSYLVSRLDGLSFEIIKDMIDKSVDADKSGEAAWILDNDPASISYVPVNGQFTEAKSRLENYGFNVVYNNTDEWITHNTYNDGPVMGYTSLGVHAESSNPAYQTYVSDSLLFNYANGSVFNTYESYNAYSISTLKRVGQGVMTEFTEIGGTSGAGHIWEPYSPAVSKAHVFFPYYAMGYNQIDAVWQGFSYLAWRNVVVGDPLTTIAYGKQELLSNTIWKDTILVTDTIVIPLSKSLTVKDGALIKFKHNGFVTGEGDFVVDSSFTFVISSWNRALFLSSENDHPKLLWGDHPSIGAATHYEIFRKFDDDGRWTAIDTVTNHKFVDTAVTINDPNQGFGTNVYYKIKSYKAPSTLSAFSNTIKVNVEEDQLPKEYIAGTNYDYNLYQNYPNPFNPVTSLKYSVKKAGNVSLIIFDILGNKVAELVNETQSPGNYKVHFNASNYASGIYFYKLQVNDFVSIKKMVLLR